MSSLNMSRKYSLETLDNHPTKTITQRCFNRFSIGRFDTISFRNHSTPSAYLRSSSRFPLETVSKLSDSRNVSYVTIRIEAIISSQIHNPFRDHRAIFHCRANEIDAGRNGCVGMPNEFLCRGGVLPPFCDIWARRPRPYNLPTNIIYLDFRAIGNCDLTG